MKEVEKLLSQWQKLDKETDEIAFVEKVKAEFESKTNAEKKQFADDFFESATLEVDKANDLIEIESIREKLTPILEYVSLATLAKKYFGKSRAWFYQRLNANMVNGKPSRFTEDEKKQLRFALSDISKKMQETAISI